MSNDNKKMKLDLDRFKVQSFVTTLSAKQEEQVGGMDIIACGVSLCPPCTREIPCWSRGQNCNSDKSQCFCPIDLFGIAGN